MILFITRNMPAPAGSGGTQRAMHLLRAVARHGPVDLLMLHRAIDTEPVTATFDPVLPLVRTCRKFQIDEWAPFWTRPSALPWRVRQAREALTNRSTEAPQFSTRTVRSISNLLPQETYDLIFACRLSSAWIADQLIARGVLTSSRRVVELDDLLSVFRRRQIEMSKPRKDWLDRIIEHREVRAIESAERTVVRTWDAVSLAGDQDATQLTLRTGRFVHVVPNVVDRPEIPVGDGNGSRILFVGHLSYDPNVLGLTRFMVEIWPQVRIQLPTARLDIVGVAPDPALAKLAANSGAQLHANVPSVEPFYRDCDFVIAPIWDGGGTRIKILEAMAYGRPVVSTTIGAEGLHVSPGVHALIADSSSEFAEAVVRMARDHELRQRLACQARRLQQDRFMPASLNAAVDNMISGLTPA